jgi:asparagine synthase (glutamine-hydrolysing)
MCGIAGFVVEPEAADPSDLEAMCTTLAHRGPDDADARVWPDHGVGLGHRRLSIIDLSPSGRNPMPNEDETVWVVHNGEIYNYRELRRELEAAGHRFRSDSDTEVIVHGYEEWGDAHVERLSGMFAYGLYDRRAAAPRVLLIRDRLGIKPLHYAWDGRRFAFASELKGLLALPWVDRTPDRTALVDYLSYLYVPAPKTAFAGMRKVLPAERLVLEEGRIDRTRYWDLPAPAPAPAGDGGVADAVDRVRALLSAAVERHMVADVPVGVFLSGGLDSSAVATLMSETADGPVRAYTIGFDVAEHSETGYAALVAERSGLAHRVRSVSVDDVRTALDRVTSLHDEPFADASSLPTLRVAELAREDVKVALAGDGGDEVFGGYWWYDAWRKGTRFDRLPVPLRRVAARGLTLLPRLREVTWLSELGEPGLERYAALVQLFTPDEKRALVTRDLERHLVGYDDHWHLREHWRDDLDPTTRMQVVDLHTYLPGDILTKVDRATMAVSLEARPPLLDHELVEAVLGLPAAVRGENKSLLKRAMADRLPREIIERPKQGFSVPWKVWQEQLRPWASDELRGGALADSGLFEPARLEDLDGPRAGARTWALLVLERWARRHL